jgi:hypothetical protein
MPPTWWVEGARGAIVAIVYSSSGEWTTMNDDA